MSLISPRRCSPLRLITATCSRVAASDVLVQHQVGVAEDGRHRSADLVAHVGQELALGAVGGIGGVFGLAEFVFHLLPFGDVLIDSDNAIDLPFGIRSGSFVVSSQMKVPSGRCCRSTMCAFPSRRHDLSVVCAIGFRVLARPGRSKSVFPARPRDEDALPGKRFVAAEIDAFTVFPEDGKRNRIEDARKHRFVLAGASCVRLRSEMSRIMPRVQWVAPGHLE